MTNVNIISYNVQGIGSSSKRVDVFNYLKDKIAHIYCLQDVHSTSSTENFIRTQWGNNAFFSSGTSNLRGVAILFNKNIDFKVHNIKSDKCGNFLIMDLTVDNNRFTLVNLYGPNIDSPMFFEEVIQIVNQFNNDSLIMCGDFN